MKIIITMIGVVAIYLGTAWVSVELANKEHPFLAFFLMALLACSSSITVGGGAE